MCLSIHYIIRFRGEQYMALGLDCLVGNRKTETMIIHGLYTNSDIVLVVSDGVIINLKLCVLNNFTISHNSMGCRIQLGVLIFLCAGGG